MPRVGDRTASGGSSCHSLTAGEEGAASVVSAAAEALVFEAVVAASCTPCCRFFFGKNKVMMLALGRGPDDEHLDGLHNLSDHLHGETGLLFTNKKKAEVLK